MSAAETSSTVGPHAGVVGFVRGNPGTTVLAIAALTVVVIILLGTTSYYRGKSGFQGSVTPGNFTITGMNPLWHMGSENAGMWGSIDRAPTETNMAAYNPSFRMGARDAAARQGLRKLRATPGGTVPPGPNATAYKSGRGPRAMAAGRRETLAGAPLDADDAMGGVDPDPDNFNPETQCTEWDPDATVEAQALASVGGLAGGNSAEGPLRNAIDLATDDSSGLTAPALASLARYSAAP